MAHHHLFAQVYVATYRSRVRGAAKHWAIYIKDPMEGKSIHQVLIDGGEWDVAR